MTLEEAIRYAKEVAEEQEQKAKDKRRIEDNMAELIGGSPDYREAEACEECAKEHRQLAEWLRELKAYREQLPYEITEVKKRQMKTLEVNVTNEQYNPYLAEFVKGYLCALSYVEGIIAKIIEEVNADAKEEET